MAHTKKSIVVVPTFDADSEYEEAEIAAQIHVPKEGGWGWVVVAASFFNIMVLDGVAYTFGSQMVDIAKDFQCSVTQISVANSVASALYLMCGPVVSAIINRFGFRASAMTGATICSFSLLTCYFVRSYPLFIIFYGCTLGIGFSLVNMSACLVVGFYFEKLRPVALSIALVGSSMGVMTMFPLNTFLVSVGGWRPLVLLHSGMFGFVYFASMTYKPLLSLTVIKDAQDPTKTVTYLPNVGASTLQQKSRQGTAAERMLKSVANVHYPTAAAVIEEVPKTATRVEPGPSSTPGVSRITLAAHKSRTGAMSTLQVKQMKSIMQQSKINNTIDLKVSDSSESSEKKPGCCGRHCAWDSHVEQSRPMYRDDAFYEGKVQNLPEYQKSTFNVPKDQQTGLEYQMAVSRAVTTADLSERKGICTTAIRRVLVTMVDPKLLKRNSYRLMCLSGFLVYIGILVPYVYLSNRNIAAGMDPTVCMYLVSVLGFANACGRLILGALATKFNPVRLGAASFIIAGASTMCSDLMINLYYQALYSVIFGFCGAGVSCLRSMMIVSLYGLDSLTNATGVIQLFQGIGSLIGTPLAGALSQSFGYRVAFMVAGLSVAVSGVCLVPVEMCCNREKKKSEKVQLQNKSASVVAPSKSASNAASKIAKA